MNILFLTGFILLAVGLVKAIGALYAGLIFVTLAILVELG